MKRLQKRLAQLEAKLRYMSNKLSASKLFGIIRQILVVEAMIEKLSQPVKSDLEVAIELLKAENEMCGMCPAPDEYFEVIQPAILALPRDIYKKALVALR